MAEGLRYKDKVIIITGGSSGIGKGCLQVFGKLHFLYLNSVGSNCFYSIT